jgi:hypothetical protein
VCFVAMILAVRLLWSPSPKNERTPTDDAAQQDDAADDASRRR